MTTLQETQTSEVTDFNYMLKYFVGGHVFMFDVPVKLEKPKRIAYVMPARTKRNVPRTIRVKLEGM